MISCHIATNNQGKAKIQNNLGLNMRWLSLCPVYCVFIAYVSCHFVTLWSFAVVYQKLNRHDEEAKDQPWGEQSSDESSTEEDEV